MQRRERILMWSALGMTVAALFFMLIGSVVAAAVISLFIKLACRLVLGESPTFLKGIGVGYVQLIAGFFIQIVLGVIAAFAPIFVLTGPAWIFLLNTAVLRIMIIDTFAKSLLVSFVVSLLQLALVVIFAVAFVVFASGTI